MNSFLTNLLKSPTALENSKDPLPFLFSNNKIAKFQWNIKLNNYRAQIIQKNSAIKKALNHVEVTPLNKKRLQQLLDAEILHQQQFESLMQPFGFIDSEINTQLILQQRIPSQQHFESYKSNIYRDWAWGAEENNIYNSLLQKLNLTEGKVLIIGGGAGRLLFDLCTAKPKLEVVQIDINPLLSIIGHKLCSGESLQLTELAQFNIRMQDAAKTHILKAEKSLNPEQFQFVLGDILDHPFQDQIFDAVICPWVIDILPENFNDFSKRLNNLLKTEAEFLIFGPLSFEKQTILNRLTQEEVLETLNENGFQTKDSQSLVVPYLHSPLESLKRYEEISFFYGHKNKNTKKPKALPSYPNWMLDTKQKLPAQNQNLLSLQSQKNVEAQFLAGLISGKSIAEMAQLIANSGTGMSAQQAEDFILSLLTRLFESGELKNDYF